MLDEKSTTPVPHLAVSEWACVDSRFLDSFSLHTMKIQPKLLQTMSLVLRMRRFYTIACRCTSINSAEERADHFSVQ